MLRLSRPWRIALLLTALATLLAACSSAPLKSAYLAAGDGTRPDELNKTATFKADDDLNVVVTLNAHNRTIEVTATFTAPDGHVYATDPLEADPTAGQVVLGLDWEAQGGQSWPPGEWTVDVVVDGKHRETLRFAVEPPPATPVS